MTDVTVTVIVKIDQKEKTYEATEADLSKARYQAEKKARAYLRRQGLSVKMDNVHKVRCEDCPTKTIITVDDLIVPPPQTEAEMEKDDLEWLLDDSRHL